MNEISPLKYTRTYTACDKCDIKITFTSLYVYSYTRTLNNTKDL